MAYDGSGGTWLARWRAGCKAKDVACLLALLVEGREWGMASVGTLTPEDVAEAARVACEAGRGGLLLGVVGLAEEGGSDMHGVFDSPLSS